MSLNSKGILVSFFIIIILGLSYTYLAGKNEENQHRTNYELYKQARDFIDEKDGFRALPLLMELDKKYPDNEYIAKYIGMAQAYRGDYDTASLSYERSLDINASLQLDPDFSVDYATILVYSQEYDKAEKLLNYASHLVGAENYMEKINKLKKFINEQK